MSILNSVKNEFFSYIGANNIFYSSKSMKSIRQGFTLVELIVVITILAILGTISFISFTSYNQSARNSIRLDGISKVATILENEKIIGKSLL